MGTEQPIFEQCGEVFVVICVDGCEPEVVKVPEKGGLFEQLEGMVGDTIVAEVCVADVGEGLGLLERPEVAHGQAHLVEIEGADNFEARIIFFAKEQGVPFLWKTTGDIGKCL